MAIPVLKINGVVMPSPKYNGFNISKNKIWSKNTGRNNAGTMVGSIIAIKRKVEIEWAILTPEQMELIDNQVSDPKAPFVSIEYLNEKGTKTTMTCYFGDITFSMLSRRMGGNNLRSSGVKLSAIER